MTNGSELGPRLRRHYLAIADDRPAPDALATALARTAAVTPRPRWLTFTLRPWTAQIRLAIVIGALLALLLLLAFVFGTPRPAPTKATNGSVAIAVDGKAGADMTAYSGDPRSVIHVSDIYIVGDGVARRLIGTADDGLHQTCPAFAPDGTQLAYLEGRPMSEAGGSAQRAQAAEWTLVVADIDAAARLTGTEWRIDIPLSAAGPAPCAAWSPTGGRLAYATPDGLHVVTVGEQAELLLAQPLAVGLWSAGDVHWSPDGERVAYLTSVPGAGDVWIVSVDGSPAIARPVGSRSEILHSVAWSPDGRRVAVRGDLAKIAPNSLSYGAMGSFIRTAAADNTSLPVATDSWLDGGAVGLAWTPNRRLAYLRGTEVVVRDPADDSSVVIGPAALDGSAPLLDLRWSPDGKRLIFLAAGEHGTYGLVSIDPAGDTPPVALTPWTAGLYPPVEGELSWQAVYR